MVRPLLHCIVLMDRLLILESIRTAGRQLNVRYSYDQYRFSTSFWYEFNLQSLEELYGAPFMENVYFTCAAIDMIKFVSLKPTSIDFGSYSRLVTGELSRASLAHNCRQSVIAMAIREQRSSLEAATIQHYEC